MAYNPPGTTTLSRVNVGTTYNVNVALSGARVVAAQPITFTVSGPNVLLNFSLLANANAVASTTIDFTLPNTFPAPARTCQYPILTVNGAYTVPGQLIVRTDRTCSIDTFDPTVGSVGNSFSNTQNCGIPEFTVVVYNTAG